MYGQAAVGPDLRAAFNKADSKVKRLESNLAAARAERDELEVAMKVLIRHGFMDADKFEATNANRNALMNEQQALVYGCVPISETWSVAPKDVAAMLHAHGHTDITADYVRTTLWRFAKRGTILSENGLYWRPDAPEAENVAAPDASTSEADNGTVGPLGGGSGFPPSAPEGSIPSGSTQPGSASFDADLDDDVPF